MRNNERMFAAGLMMVAGALTMYQLSDKTQKFVKSLEGKPFDPMAVLSIALVVCYTTFRLWPLLERYIGIFANNGIEPANPQGNNAPVFRG